MLFELYSASDGNRLWAAADAVGEAMTGLDAGAGHTSGHNLHFGAAP